MDTAAPPRDGGIRHRACGGWNPPTPWAVARHWIAANGETTSLWGSVIGYAKTPRARGAVQSQAAPTGAAPPCESLHTGPRTKTGRGACVNSRPARCLALQGGVALKRLAR